MPEDFLLRRQKLELARAIIANGFPATDFSQGDWPAELVGFDAPGPASAVVYQHSTERAFAIREETLDDRYTFAMRPGRTSRREMGHGASWSQVTEMFGHWLAVLREELDLPDLWAELAAHQTVLLGTADNSPLTPREQEDVRARLDQILAEVRAVHGHVARVEEDSQYLKDAAKRSGRRDWTTMALGTVFNWLLSSVLPPSTVQAITTRILAAAESLWQRMLPP